MGAVEIHSYLTQHEGPHPAAPYRYSTYLTPTPTSDGTVHSATAGVGRVLGTRHRVLDYPAVPAGSRQGVEFVAQRYSHCDRCHLSASRMRVCMVKGNVDSTVAVVCESPKQSDDMRGEVFCGPDGKLQDELLREVGIQTRDLAWLSLVGCRAHDGRGEPDRAPSEVEKIACSERTLGLLQAIRPRVVLCLGDGATAMFWDKPPKPNTWHVLRPREHPDDWIAVGVGRHPGYLLRSVMTRYQEYFAAKLFLRRLKRRMPTLTKTSAWRFGLRYASLDRCLWDSHDPRR